MKNWIFVARTRPECPNKPNKTATDSCEGISRFFGDRMNLRQIRNLDVSQLRLHRGANAGRGAEMVWGWHFIGSCVCEYWERFVLGGTVSRARECGPGRTDVLAVRWC